MNICIFASGTGSNFKALVESAEAGYLTSRISLLITNNSNSGAAGIAAKHGIDCVHISRQKFPEISEAEYADLFSKELESRAIDFIALCGYMKPVLPSVLSKYKDRIVNVHPALIPSFSGKGMFGMHIHKAVIQSGVKVTGLTIHFVDGEYDSGRIIFQKCCDVLADDDAESLCERVKRLEHRYYPEIIKMFEEGRVRISPDKVNIV